MYVYTRVYACVRAPLCEWDRVEYACVCVCELPVDDFLSVRLMYVYACLLCMFMCMNVRVCVCVLCAVVVYKPIEIDLT